MDFEVYCDESRQEYFANPFAASGKYVLPGSLWIEAQQRSI